MDGCPLLDGCIFFNDKMANMPATTEIIKKRYCKKDYERCYRFKVAENLGRENVPDDLYPNESGRAEEIIASKGE